MAVFILWPKTEYVLWIPTGELNNLLFSHTGFTEVVQLLCESEDQQAATGQTRHEYAKCHVGNFKPGESMLQQRQSLDTEGNLKQAESHDDTKTNYFWTLYLLLIS